MINNILYRKANGLTVQDVVIDHKGPDLFVDYDTVWYHIVGE